MSHRERSDHASEDALPIGEFARRSGLSVSALRFYDREGVLRPEAVDTGTGYRRYAPGQVRIARVVAGMRRIGMPLVEIRETVEHADDAEMVAGLLDQHLTRLESGLADARREIGRLRTALSRPVDEVTARVCVRDLRRLVEAVAFAVGADPETPILHGALLEIEPDTVRLVATDRYRLAVHGISATATGERAGVLPADFLQAFLGELDRAGAGDVLTLRLHGRSVRAEVGNQVMESELIEGDYPDYRRLLTDSSTDELSWTEELVSVDVPEPGLATLSGLEEPVVVRHEFLLEALTAAGPRATLRLDGPITPLAVRASDGALSLLMPTRTEGER